MATASREGHANIKRPQSYFWRGLVKGLFMNMQTKKTVLHHAGDIAKQLTAIAGASVLIAGALWWMLEGQARNLARDIAGTDEVVAAVESVAEEQSEQRIILEEVIVRVNRLEPEPTVTEYDPLRSKVFTPCVIGEVCEWQYLLRRTDFGASCSTPISSTRVIVDSSGIQHLPVRANENPIRRLNTEWTVVRGSFIVPEAANHGVAEFFLVVNYENCGPDKNQSMQQQSLPLVFEIVER